MKREHGHVGVTAGAHRNGPAGAGRIGGAKGVAGVLHHLQAALGGEAGDGLRVRALAVQMDGKDRLDVFAGRTLQGGPEMACLHEPGVRRHIGEEDVRPDVAGGVGGGQEGQRGHHDPVAGAQAEGQGGQMQGGGAAGAGDGEAGAHLGRERLFEGRYRGAGGQPVTAKDRGHRGHVVVVDGLPAVRQEGRRWRGAGHQRGPERYSRNPSSSSHWVLLLLA